MITFSKNNKYNWNFGRTLKQLFYLFFKKILRKIEHIIIVMNEIIKIRNLYEEEIDI